MTIDNQSQLSLSHLRHELRTPINAIIGYSDMIVEEFEDINLDVEYLNELEEIRECGARLLVSINNYLNPATIPQSQVELEKIITNPKLKVKLQIPTKLVISNCQQLIPIIKTEFVADVEKINLAANKLLQEIEDLLTIHSEETTLPLVEELPLPEINYSPATTSVLDIVIDSGLLLAEETKQPLDHRKYTILIVDDNSTCLLYTSPSPRDLSTSRMPSSA